MPLTENRMIWTDAETFGLDTERDLLLEVGFKITTLDLDIVDERRVLIWETPIHDQRLDKLVTNPADKFVFDMHLKNGLLDEAAEVGMTFAAAQEDLLDWLRSHGVTKEEPLCGSSVHFDRAKYAYWMPSVEAMFSYRNIDISTLKELASGYHPQVLTIRPKPESNHRVLPDIDDTIAEFDSYLNYFLKATV